MAKGGSGSGSAGATDFMSLVCSISLFLVSRMGVVLLVVLLVAYSWQGKGGSGSAVATDFMPPMCSSSVYLGSKVAWPGS